MQPLNTRAYENTEKSINKTLGATLLVNATQRAQLEVLRAHKGEVTSEFMNEQIGSKLAKGFRILLVGYPPREGMQFVRATPKPPSKRKRHRLEMAMKNR